MRIFAVGVSGGVVLGDSRNGGYGGGGKGSMGGKKKRDFFWRRVVGKGDGDGEMGVGRRGWGGGEGVRGKKGGGGGLRSVEMGWGRQKNELSRQGKNGVQRISFYVRRNSSPSLPPLPYNDKRKGYLIFSHSHLLSRQKPSKKNPPAAPTNSFKLLQTPVPESSAKRKKEYRR